MQPLFHIRPLRRHDRKARRVASDEVGSHAMGAEDSFELAADAFDGRAGTLVAHVRVKADAQQRWAIAYEIKRLQRRLCLL
jgi:hypothetical protein